VAEKVEEPRELPQVEIDQLSQEAREAQMRADLFLDQ
jgi:hypothetical protein